MCGVNCAALGVVEGVCYVMLYVRFRQQLIEAAEGSESQKKQRKMEMKLIWLGVTLFLVQCLCTAFCTTVSFATTEEIKQVQMFINHNFTAAGYLEKILWT